MIPHGRTETGKLVISRSEISDGMRRINASQDRMLNRRLEIIERQERTAQANHKKIIKRAVGDQDPKSLQQARSGATVDYPRREGDARLLQSQRGASLDLAQYDAIRQSRSRGQWQRLRGQRPPQGADAKGDQPTETSPVGHRWNGMDTSMKAEGFESGGAKTFSSTALLYAGRRMGRSEVSPSPLTQGSLVVSGQGSASTSPSPSRPG